VGQNRMIQEVAQEIHADARIVMSRTFLASRAAIYRSGKICVEETERENTTCPRKKP
jgi:hypothetical protein